MKNTESRKKDRYDYLIIILSSIILVGGFRFLAFKHLGQSCDISTWEASYNVRNIYNDFNNQGKNMEIAGLYEQTFRNSFLYIKDIITENKKKLSKEVNDIISSEENITEDNQYTGIFKDKNLVFVLMESVDSFLVNEKVMPTLTKLENEGWNFTNRYAPPFGGGQTINSEFAANTGLYAINNSKAIYNYDNNNFPYSVASLMKENDYIVESIHENKGSFYNRISFHKALGYTSHYAINDIKEFNDGTDYSLDSNLLKKDDIYNLIVKDDKFMTFITTYSAHLPYNNTNPNCNNIYGLDIEENEELGCINNLAHDTDEFLKGLIDKMDEDTLNNTVFVLFTDHYAYGYSDVDYIKNYKNVDNLNLIQNVPFVIWTPGIEHKEINTLMDTADIAPTILNLFGIKTDSRNYIGQDVFNSNRDKFIYFSDSIFYDGTLYYDGKNKITENNKDYVSNTLSTIRKRITTNNNIILGNYFYYYK